MEENKVIADNPWYSIIVSPSKNRIFLKIIGFWRTPDEVSGYVNDWKKAINEVKPGFTVLTDITQMKTAPQEVSKVHAEAQEVVKSGGVKEVAEVWNQYMVKAQIDAISKESKMPRNAFQTIQEAETFLDSLN